MEQWAQTLGKINKLKQDDQNKDEENVKHKKKKNNTSKAEEWKERWKDGKKVEKRKGEHIERKHGTVERNMERVTEK